MRMSHLMVLACAATAVQLPALANPLTHTMADATGTFGVWDPSRCHERVNCDGTQAEGEAAYSDGVDLVNGGCNTVPPVFGSMACGGSYCGNMFGYDFQGGQFRDTDWFLLDAGAGAQVDVTVHGETNFRIFLIYMMPDCDNYVYDTAVGGVGQPATLSSQALPAGVQLVLWIGTDWFGGDGTEYAWRAEITGDCGGTVEAVEQPSAFALAQNAPNPFNPVTGIEFTLDGASHASLKVFDMAGHEVATLVDGLLEGGAHHVAFDGANLASGLYVYTLRAEGRLESRKMLLMK